MNFKYSTVQLQLHITTRYHACQRVQHAKSSCVPRRDSAWHTSKATSNIAMRGHVWQLIVQGCNDCLSYLTPDLNGREHSKLQLN